MGLLRPPPRPTHYKLLTSHVVLSNWRRTGHCCCWPSFLPVALNPVLLPNYHFQLILPNKAKVLEKENNCGLSLVTQSSQITSFWHFCLQQIISLQPIVKFSGCPNPHQDHIGSQIVHHRQFIGEFSSQKSTHVPKQHPLPQKRPKFHAHQRAMLLSRQRR